MPKASDDLPEPETPENTTSALRGMETSTFLRLCSRAPRTSTQPLAAAAHDDSPKGVLDIFAILQAVSGTHQRVPGALFSLLRG